MLPVSRRPTPSNSSPAIPPHFFRSQCINWTEKAHVQPFFLIHSSRTVRDAVEVQPWRESLNSIYKYPLRRLPHRPVQAAFKRTRPLTGSLKLIDFGIAKAIMSDTTNIHRDAQVGTLNYMSPKAFMWNEQDANGNTIKSGRPSDIWSLGCILYQMVYGRTPFANGKTFWAKFKVITDRNHEIKYDPVSNPWLLDLMKKCLAWDRSKRWCILHLLQQPFLVPFTPTSVALFKGSTL